MATSPNIVRVGHDFEFVTGENSAFAKDFNARKDALNSRGLIPKSTNRVHQFDDDLSKVMTGRLMRVAKPVSFASQSGDAAKLGRFGSFGSFASHEVATAGSESAAQNDNTITPSPFKGFGRG